jgi:hypothetical protein
MTKFIIILPYRIALYILDNRGRHLLGKLEPIATLVKQNCKALWSPSSHLAVNEAIIAYRGRTIDKVKLPNKPIKGGYKV